MDFPHIRSIEDVLPHIEGRTDFVVARKENYTVIDYVYALSDTFDDPVRRECRGLKFDLNGNLIARPLHKFFNLGERADTTEQNIDWRSCTIMEKLDGSMVHGAMIDDQFVFMTRMGRTDVARKAERHITENLRLYCQLLIQGVGFTPIFEWTAPDNRIVVAYEESRLTLLAVRGIHAGDYLCNDIVRRLAAEIGIPCPQVQPNPLSAPNSFIAKARSLEKEEGFVLRQEDGPWIKIKADAYVRKHRAKDAISQEKNILRLVLNNELDDVLPLLADDEKSAVLQYQADVQRGVDQTVTSAREYIIAHRDCSQKEFALSIAPSTPAVVRATYFRARASNENIRKDIVSTILQNTGTQARVDQARALHNAVYQAA